MNCPGEEVLVGIQATVGAGGGLVQLQLVCGDVVLDKTDGVWTTDVVEPVLVPDASPLLDEGRTDVIRSQCAAGHFVSGVTLDSSASTGAVTGLTVSCTEIRLDETSGYTFAVASNGTQIGTDAAIEDTSACHADNVGEGAEFTLSSRLDGLALRCFDPIFDRTEIGPIVGRAGGGSGLYDCPAGMLPVGFRANEGTSFWRGAANRYQFTCQEIQISLTTGFPQILHGDTVLVPEGATRRTAGTGGTRESAECPTGTAIRTWQTSTGGRDGRPDGFTATCSPLVLGTGGSGWSLEFGTGDTTISIRAAGGTATECPAGTFFSGHFTRSGDVLDGLYFRCRPLQPVIIE